MQISELLLPCKRLPWTEMLAFQGDDVCGQDAAEIASEENLGPPITDGKQFACACATCGLVLPCPSWVDLHESEVHTPELRAMAREGKWVS